MKPIFKFTSGFTLIEMIVVISIIMILFGISMFPYRFYMQRAYTERAADGLAQEWVLAHKAIRWGIEFDPVAGTHARLLFIFEKGKSVVNSYLLASGSLITDMSILPTDPTQIQPYKIYTMDDGVEILGFSGSVATTETRLGYLISPPYGSGVFFTGSLTSWLSLLNTRIIIGYQGTSNDNWRSREVLLRPYLQ